MRTAYQIITIIILSFGITSQAMATGIWLEPFAGYELGARKVGTTSYDESGMNLGFRVGAVTESIYFGLDYTLASLTVDQPGKNDSLKTKDWGFFVGVDFAMVRLWFTYLFDSENDSDNANGTYKGNGGYKLGLGFKAFSQLSINVEKTLRIYSKLDQNQQNPKYELDGLLVGVSLPFTF